MFDYSRYNLLTQIGNYSYLIMHIISELLFKDDRSSFTIFFQAMRILRKLCVVVSQQCRAWSDCTDVNAGLALR